MFGIVNVSSDLHFSLLPLPPLTFCTSCILEGVGGKVNAGRIKRAWWHGGMVL